MMKLPKNIKGRNQSKKAGYEYLLAYKITVPIYDYTLAFCKRCQSPNFSNFAELSSSRTFDQMVQAARSGNTNIPEGNQQKRLAQSLEGKFVEQGGFRENLFRKRLENKQGKYVK